jgi:hypothetical protein
LVILDIILSKFQVSSSILQDNVFSGPSLLFQVGKQIMYVMRYRDSYIKYVFHPETFLKPLFGFLLKISGLTVGVEIMMCGKEAFLESFLDS